jgi:hypothetical protein
MGLAGSLLIVTGCSGTTPDRAALHVTPPLERVSSSVGPAMWSSYSPCALRGLKITFGPSGYGVGHAFGALHIRDRSHRPCTMTAPVRVTPLNGAGHQLRFASTLTSRPARRPLVLTGTRRGPRDDPHEVASVGVWMEGTTGGALPGGCPAGHLLEPAKWRVVINAEAVVLSNHPADTHVIACQDRRVHLSLNIQRQVAESHLP